MPVVRNPAAEEFGGFTTREVDRMIKALRTNRVTLRRLVSKLGLQCTTTAYAVKAIREYRS